MKFIKWLLLIAISCTIFYLIKPIEDIYCYMVGVTIGNISGAYFYEHFIEGDKNE